MNISIYRNNQEEGPYDELTIQEMLSSGQLSLDDYAWKGGMEDWAPLNTVIGDSAGTVEVPASTETMSRMLGITTDPNHRILRWQSKVDGLQNWIILAKCSTKEIAQRKENEFAVKYGCRANGGGKETSGPWYVYSFNYTRMK